MKAGGEHWEWNPDIPFYLGVLPRRGAKGSDVKVCKDFLICQLLDKRHRSMIPTN